MNLTELFSPDYFTARERFRQAATRLGWQLESHPIDAAGPQGEEPTAENDDGLVRKDSRGDRTTSGMDQLWIKAVLK